MLEFVVSPCIRQPSEDGGTVVVWPIVSEDGATGNVSSPPSAFGDTRPDAQAIADALNAALDTPPSGS